MLVLHISLSRWNCWKAGALAIMQGRLPPLAAWELYLPLSPPASELPAPVEKNIMISQLKQQHLRQCPLG